LYRFFLENDDKGTDFESFLETLPSNWEALSIETALKAVAIAFCSSEKLPENTPLLIYLGLDEFNKMESTCRNCDYTKKEHLRLRHIVNAIGGAYVRPPQGIKLAFCMAGVYFEPLISISLESGYPLRQIPISLVSEREFLRSILKDWTIHEKKITIDSSWLDFPPFRHALAFWSGIPGYSVEFLLNLLKEMARTNLEINLCKSLIDEIQEEQIQSVRKRLRAIPYEGLLNMVATSIAQRTVDLGHPWRSGIKNIDTWEKAQQLGLCVVHNNRVKIPLCFLMVIFQLRFFFFAQF
jgi:hypothetical protein